MSTFGIDLTNLIEEFPILEPETQEYVILLYAYHRSDYKDIRLVFYLNMAELSKDRTEEATRFGPQGLATSPSWFRELISPSPKVSSFVT